MYTIVLLTLILLFSYPPALDPTTQDRSIVARVWESAWSSSPIHHDLWVNAVFAIGAHQKEILSSDHAVAGFATIVKQVFHLRTQIHFVVLQKLHRAAVWQRIRHVHVASHQGEKRRHLLHARDLQCVYLFHKFFLESNILLHATGQDIFCHKALLPKGTSAGLRASLAVFLIGTFVTADPTNRFFHRFHPLSKMRIL